jgi:hypothetical protein
MTTDRHTRRGERAPNASLSNAQAHEYRRRYHHAVPRPTILQLAEEARVGWSTMQQICSGKTYHEEALTES